MRLNWPICSKTIFAWIMLGYPIAALGQAVKVTQRGAAPNIGANSLTVSATPATVNIDLTAKKESSGSNPINITTTYSNLTLSGNLSLYAFFISANAALIGTLSPSAIPSSSVFGQMTTGVPTSYMAFTQTSPVGGAGASLKLLSQHVLAGAGTSRTDVLNLRIDLTNLPQLPADTYTGTLILQAQAP